MTRLLIPGLTCATVHPAPRSGVLVDGRDFYKALFDACLAAERSILMAGWQFASKVELLRGDDAKDCERPTRLVELLADLCDRRPELEIHLLAWDASAVFTFEREPLQRLWFHVRGHERIHYKMDNRHPTGASHHQKLVVIDRSIAFLGGMDVCTSRWDNREHCADSPHRCGPFGRKYTPYHDVQAFVTGEPVDLLRDWFAERWQLATDHELPAADVPRRTIAIRSSFDVEAPIIGFARTLPRLEGVPRASVKELYELHKRAIANAQRSIYIENQYFSSDELCRSLEERMGRGGPPLEIVLVLPEQSAGFKERISIGVYQQRILERLGREAAATGHHLGVYYQAAKGKHGDVPVFIHAKVLAVDDRFLLVSSANTSNRSMGFDTELGIAWEADEPTESLRDARVDLLAEHAGVPPEQLRELAGLVDRLDAIARSGAHSLRLHRRNVDEQPGWLLSKLVPDETPFDPDDPQSMEEMLPEPAAWLDRVFRDPVVLARGGGRHLRHRLAHRKALKAGS